MSDNEEQVSANDRGDSFENEDSRPLQENDSHQIEEFEMPKENELPLESGIPDENGNNEQPIMSLAGEDNSIRFQLIPISMERGKNSVGEVCERKLKNGDVIKIGRQVIRDGQAVIKGNKPATELDCWFTSKVVSRLHAEIWAKDNQLVLKDVGSSSGTFLNKMRLSPSGKESRPYPLKQGDVIQFGVDFKGKGDTIDPSYRAITMKIGFHDQSWLKAQKNNANPVKFTEGLKQMLAASNPYGAKNSELAMEGEIECCICINEISPFQALFIAPCSHCYHFKCVSNLVTQSPMFQCPLCRQVANLTASVSCESLNEKESDKIVIPLPVLESELPAPDSKEKAKEDKNKASQPRSRRPSLVKEGKRLLENFGLRKQKDPQPLPEGSTNDGQTPPTHESKNSKRRAFSERFKTFGSKGLQEPAIAGPIELPESNLSSHSEQRVGDDQGPSRPSVVEASIAENE